MAALPTDLPPRSTVWDYLDLWDWDGTLERIHHALYVEVRELAGREASPTTAIIDSQTARGAVKGGLRSTRGLRRGKKVLGRKRHVLTDTLGLLLGRRGHPANVQDRDGVEALLREARRSFPFLERTIGDAGYQGRKTDAAVASTGKWQLEIISAATGNVSSCCRNAGSWNEHSAGSAGVGGSPATTSGTPERLPPSSGSP